MTPRKLRRRPAPALGVAVSLLLVVPLAPAHASGGATGVRASAGAERTRPAAAPQSDALGTLAGLLDRLLSPAPAPALATALQDRVAASTVRVQGRACGLLLTGSGFSPAPDVVVTNAHVVAGVANPVVRRPDGTTLAARVQVFDPQRDLAVLAVPGLGQPALPLAAGAVGEAAAIFGHPFGQAQVSVTPARVTRKLVIDMGDIYDSGPGVRRILVLNARVNPGDSGAAVVNAVGQVIGVAFATAVSRPSTAFAVASEELGSVLARTRGATAATGPCLAA